MGIITLNTDFSIKDSIDFIANHEKKSSDEIIIEALNQYILEKKQEIENKKIAEKKAIKILKTYKKDRIGYTFNDFK